MIVVFKLCAFATLIFALLLGFQLIVDVLRFGGARLSSGAIQPLGMTLVFAGLFVAMLLTALEGLLA